MLITLARKPLIGSVVQNCLQHGCGALNVDASRVASSESIPTFTSSTSVRWGNKGLPEGIKIQRTGETRVTGRFPANVLLVPTPDVLAGFPDTGKSGVAVQRNRDGEVHNAILSPRKCPAIADVGFADSGSVARFFKQIKDTP